MAIGCWLLAVGCGRHIGATGIVKSQSGGDESVEAEAEAAAVDALRFRHIGLEVIIRRLVAEVEADATEAEADATEVAIVDALKLVMAISCWPRK